MIEAARVTKQILDAIGVVSFCKTSGSTGLHIYIPFGAKYSYEDSKEFGRAIAKLVHMQIPRYTSIERKVADREGKMYIDFLQNRRRLQSQDLIHFAQNPVRRYLCHCIGMK